MTTPRDTTPATQAGPAGERSAAAPAASGPQDGRPGTPEAGAPSRPPSGQLRPAPAAPAGAVPRAGAPQPPVPGDPGPGWASARPAPEEPTPTTVLPGGTGARRPVPPRPAARPESRSDARPAAARPAAPRARRARLALRRIDPWSVFVFSLIASVFLGVALVVAVGALYAVLSALGVTGSLNQLFAEVTGASAATSPLLTGGRILGGAAVLAAVNVVLLTLLATLGSLLYNLCASFTGGLELTLGDRD